MSRYRIGLFAIGLLIICGPLLAADNTELERPRSRPELQLLMTDSELLPPEAWSQMQPLDWEPLTMLPHQYHVDGSTTKIATTVLSETFESSWPNGTWYTWHPSDKTNVEWGRTTYRKASGSYSAWCAKSGSAFPGDGQAVPVNTKSWAIAGPFNMSSYSSGSLAFALWLQTEATYDPFKVCAGTDGSNFTCYYTDTNTTGFQTVTQDLTNWGSLGDLTQSSTVYIAFIYESDSSIAYEGAYVDNVLLTGDGGGGGGTTGGLNLVINQIDPTNCPSIQGIVSVSDDQGNPVTGLTSSNFTVREDGASQTITSVQCGGTSTGNLAVALVLDSSGSLDSSEIADVKQAATAFINMLGPTDQVAVYDFDGDVSLVQDYTTNKQAAINAVNTLASGGNTALYDAIYQASGHSTTVSGRKALVVMTDGEDTASSHSQSDAINAANAAGVPVFTIGIGNGIDTTVLTSIANQTGGIYYSGASSSDLQTILNQIGTTLNSQCVITWNSSHADGSSHSVEITVQSGGLSDSKSTTYSQAGTGCGGGGGGGTGGRIVRVVDTCGTPGSTVTVPIELVSQGNENALGFTLTFQTSVLSNPSASLGSDASGATLNTNSAQVSSGRYGVALSLATSQTWSAGTRRILNVTFTIVSSTTVPSTTVGFGDQVVLREISDIYANALPASWISGSVCTSGGGYEADVAPRSTGGNGAVTTTDWVQVGRFVAALDSAQAGSEFQKADCAPRSSLGNGTISTTDWVQAGRYAAALDPLTQAGGPTSKLFNVAVSDGTKVSSPRTIRLRDTSITRGQSGTVTLELESEGNENAVGLSVNFSPSLLTFSQATLGSGASGATLNVNSSMASGGKVGIVLALPAGQTFSTGTRQLVTFSFSAASGSQTTTTNVNFGDQPVVREVSDVLAEVLTATYDTATVTLVGGGSSGPCTSNANTLCLNNDRFEVRATYRTDTGSSGNAGAVELTNDTGYFWFFDSSNVEAVIKVLNGCPFTNAYWVFAAGLTNVEVNLTVRDTQTGTIWTRQNPLGTAFQPIQDTAAFATCP